MAPPGIEHTLCRHVAFWEREPTDSPLLTRAPWRAWPPRPYPLTGGRTAHDCQLVSPGDIDVRRLVGTEKPLPALLRGELCQGIQPLYPAAWLEALAGCPIAVSAHGCVARPVGGSLAEVLAGFSPAGALQSAWFDLMQRTREACCRRAGGEYPVCQFHLRGVVDVVAAMLGEERLCLAVYDAPDALGELAARVADMFLAVVARDVGTRPLWHGGSVGLWGLYARGPLLEYQIDASSLMSPEVYAARFAQQDRRVLGAYPLNLVHLHSVGLHLLEVVLAMPEVNAVEISLDREAVPWEKAVMLRACQRVQESGKRLLIAGELSPEELREFTESLDAAGLAIDCWHESRKEAA